jgi:hypothetical protein
LLRLGRAAAAATEIQLEGLRNLVALLIDDAGRVDRSDSS